MMVPTDYIVNANPSKAKQPCDQNWSKKEPNSVCSIMLKSKKSHQDDASRNEHCIIWYMSKLKRVTMDEDYNKIVRKSVKLMNAKKKYSCIQDGSSIN